MRKLKKANCAIYSYIFYFGSIVFINFTHHEIMDVLKYLKRIEQNLQIQNPFTFQDDFILRIQADEKQNVSYTDMTTSEFHNYYLEIISTILAKSVALEKIENQTDKLFDDIELIIERLEKGRFNISDKELAKTSAKILKFKHNSLSYIMLLDKPALTWVYEEADRLYIELSDVFELDERYEKIRQKSDTLMDVTQVFSNLTHATRGTKLEWMIIILIALEILLSLAH